MYDETTATLPFGQEKQDRASRIGGTLQGRIVQSIGRSFQADRAKQDVGRRSDRSQEEITPSLG